MNESVESDDILESIFEEYNGRRYTSQIENILNRYGIQFEIIDGLIYLRANVSDHQEARRIIAFMLQLEILKGYSCRVRDESHILLDTWANRWIQNYVVAHVAVFNPDDMTTGNCGRYSAVPKLAIEVLSGNRSNDLVKKKSIYANLGVLEYWIIDLDRAEITKYELRDKLKEYTIAGTFDSGVIEHHVCGLKFDFTEFLRQFREHTSLLERNNSRNRNGNKGDIVQITDLF